MYNGYYYGRTLAISFTSNIRSITHWEETHRERYKITASHRQYLEDTSRKMDRRSRGQPPDDRETDAQTSMASAMTQVHVTNKTRSHLCMQRPRSKENPQQSGDHRTTTPAENPPRGIFRYRFSRMAQCRGLINKHTYRNGSGRTRLHLA